MNGVNDFCNINIFICNFYSERDIIIDYNKLLCNLFNIGFRKRDIIMYSLSWTN